jgi:hypothetical protein
MFLLIMKVNLFIINILVIFSLRFAVSPTMVIGRRNTNGSFSFFAVSCVKINIHTSTLLHQILLISSEFYSFFLGYLYILDSRICKLWIVFVWFYIGSWIVDHLLTFLNFQPNLILSRIIIFNCLGSITFWIHIIYRCR